VRRFRGRSKQWSRWGAPAFAWNRGGHLVSGALIYDQLRSTAPDHFPQLRILVLSSTCRGLSTVEKQFDQNNTDWLGRFVTCCGNATLREARTTG